MFHMEQSEEQETTWFFLGEDNNIIFSLTLEWKKGYTPPAELVELIELYAQGYRKETKPSSDEFARWLYK